MEDKTTIIVALAVTYILGLTTWTIVRAIKNRKINRRRAWTKRKLKK